MYRPRPAGLDPSVPTPAGRDSSMAQLAAALERNPAASVRNRGLGPGRHGQCLLCLSIDNRGAPQEEGGTGTRPPSQPGLAGWHPCSRGWTWN